VFPAFKLHDYLKRPWRDIPYLCWKCRYKHQPAKPFRRFTTPVKKIWPVCTMCRDRISKQLKSAPGVYVSWCCRELAEKESVSPPRQNSLNTARRSCASSLLTSTFTVSHIDVVRSRLYNLVDYSRCGGYISDIRFRFDFNSTLLDGRSTAYEWSLRLQEVTVAALTLTYLFIWVTGKQPTQK